MTDDSRQTLTDGTGRPVLTFVRTIRDDLPAADLVQLAPGVSSEEAASVAKTSFPGWAFSAPPELGRLLLDRGATRIRHAHVMARDLVADRPDPAWGHLVPEDPSLSVGPASLVSLDYLEAAEAAYPPEHPDWEPRPSPADRLAHDITPLLDGTLGPLLAASGVVRCPDGSVVAACLVTDRPQEGPWVVDVFRRPGADYAGLGSLLLRRALALLAQDGWPALGLAVTEGNPARSTYERLGFQHVLESLTVKLPDPR
ncbi:MAG TPA: GNAT family N-acetyltransferase [Candidatus Limnocylindria bacterium]|nr:GNAT family N-acetyltransferase [Candidatus Limnocylindria bacterium]